MTDHTGLVTNADRRARTGSSLRHPDTGESNPHEQRAMRRRRGLARASYILLRIPHMMLTSATVAIGGQAVMEGVMMRGPHTWAVAVRRYDGSIDEVHREVDSYASRHRWARIPLLRGVVALCEALMIGVKALFISSEYAIDDVNQRDTRVAGSSADGPSAEPGHAEEVVARTVHDVAVMSARGETPIAKHGVPDPDALGTWAIIGAMIMAVAFSVVVFKIFPVTVTTFLPVDRGGWSFVLIEAAIKFAMFIVYLVLIGLLPDVRRVFQYHSAEHKAIHAWEQGIALEPAKVNEMSRIHVRCGTAFIVWLFLVGLLAFRCFQLAWEGLFDSDPSRLELILSRPLLLPLVAGASFEILRFAGLHPTNVFLRPLLAPGLWFQRLTTRECTDDQCEVAVRSLETVLAAEAARSAPLSVDDVGNSEGDEVFA